jgi:hypothetical protein
MNDLTPIEQKSVDFNGTELIAVKCSDRNIYAGVRWICEGIGLTEGQRKNEMQKIQADPVLLRGGRKIILPTNGGQQEILCIDINFLPLWLAKINAGIIGNTQVQELVIEYQLKAKDVLAEAFITSKSNLPTELLNDPIIAMRYKQIEMEQRLTQVEVGTDDIKVQAATAQEQAKLAHKRINELDAVDPNGTSRQQLIKAINRYSEKNGLLYAEGWRKFREAYNIAYHTNIKTLINNHIKKNGKKNMTVPEYLEAVGKIKDGLRVANKMLHPASEYVVM